nr:hypothetical protein [uncultured Rhodopila sp.]
MVQCNINRAEASQSRTLFARGNIRKLGGALHTADGAVEAKIAHPWPSCLSLLSEADANGQAVLQAWWLQPSPSSVARGF